MAGVPYRPGPGEPVITKVVFSTTGTPTDEPADLYARRFLARTVGHLDHITVEDLVQQALRARPDYRELDYRELAIAHLLTEQLVESVLDAARLALRTRLAIDIASSLLPRLKESKA